MGISTETEELIEYYNQRISLDLNQISQLNTVEEGYTVRTGIGSTEQIKIWGPSELISLYDIPTEKIDNKIIEINSEIESRQEQILTLGQEANSVGCGTTGIGIGTTSLGFTTTTVYKDALYYGSYSYSGSNPFSQTSGILTTTNAGVGTQTYVTPVEIGSYFSPIGTCNDLLNCTPELCAGYATSIANLTSEISTLQSERNGLISKVNTLKTARSEFKLQQYAYNQSKEKLNQKIQSTQAIITFLEDPENTDWL